MRVKKKTPTLPNLVFRRPKKWWGASHGFRNRYTCKCASMLRNMSMGSWRGMNILFTRTVWEHHRYKHALGCTNVYVYTLVQQILNAIFHNILCVDIDCGMHQHNCESTQVVSTSIARNTIGETDSLNIMNHKFHVQLGASAVKGPTHT